MSQVKRQMHIGVYGVVQKDNSVLVVHKSRGPYKGLFDLPGGRPEHGEPLVETLIREFKEEVGFEPKNFSPLKNLSFLVPYINGDNEPCEFYHIALVYRIEDNDLSAINAQIHLEDVAGASWVLLEHLTKQNSSPLLLKACEQ